MSKHTRGVVLVGMLVALFLAGAVSYYANGSPDGLNRVAMDQGLDEAEKNHALADGPLAGYSTKGVDNERLSGGLAGVAGVALTFLVGGTIGLVLRRRGTDFWTAERHAERGNEHGRARYVSGT